MWFVMKRAILAALVVCLSATGTGSIAWRLFDHGATARPPVDMPSLVSQVRPGAPVITPGVSLSAIPAVPGHPAREAAAGCAGATVRPAAGAGCSAAALSTRGAAGVRPTG